MIKAHIAFASPAVAGAAAGVAAVQEGPGWIADPLLLLVCGIGVPIGILAMVGIGVSRRKPIPEIKRDILVSAFLALANFAIAVILAARLQLPYLESLGLAISVSASNAMMVERFIQKWGREAIERTGGERRQDDQRMISAAAAALRDQEKRDAEQQTSPNDQPPADPS